MGSINKWLAASATVGVLGLGLVAADVAQATEGYFQHGYGARSKALAGAGVADGRDAMTMALNPAGLVHVKYEQLQFAAGVFNPIRSYTKNQPGDPTPIAPGKIKSGKKEFVIPNIAYSRPLDDNSAIGIAMYGNGGMNTDYENIGGGHCAGAGGGSGVFCSGDTGVDLAQFFVVPTYARSFMDRVSIGISPILAMQMFKAKGLGLFAASGLSKDPQNFTNKGREFSFGLGGKIGVEVAVTDYLRVGGFYQSRIYMTRFDRYEGLFAENGDFDIPQNFQVGIAVDAMPNLTFMFDYKRIYYGDVDAIANPSTPFGAGLFGTNGGNGFGWHDIDIFKIGAEWRVNEDLTLRAGYAHNENPIKSADATINLIAPGVVKDHISGGFSYQFLKGVTFDLAGTFVPTTRVTGPDPLDTTGTNTVTIRMRQYDIKGGLTFNFGDPNYGKN